MEVLVNESNLLVGIYFQDVEMKQIFSAYPELICIDATCKLLELRFPVYIMLVEDGNGQSEIVAVFLLMEETAIHQEYGRYLQKPQPTVGSYTCVDG